jgi:hypothetical protein
LIVTTIKELLLVLTTTAAGVKGEEIATGKWK